MGYTAPLPPRLVIAEEQEVIRVAQIRAVLRRLGDPVIQIVQAEVAPKLAGQVADGQAAGTAG
jgi:hypothetical protein